MTEPALLAFVGFAAAVAGGVIQAWTGRRFEKHRFERQNRNDAYLTYLQGISELSHGSLDNDTIEAALRKIAEARGRIALYGSKPVIERMVKSFEHGEEIYSPEARSDLAAMISAMRTDSVPDERDVSAQHLVSLVFGRDENA